MVKAQSRTLIRCPLPDVYGFVVDDFVRNYPRWSPEVQRLRPLTDGPLDLGWTAHQVRVDQGRRTETDFRVIALDPQRRVCFKGIRDPFVIDYRFEPQGPHTQLTFSFELARLSLALRPFEKLIRFAVQDGTERVVRNLKGLAERELGQGSSEATTS
ncbi:SRPBCC family protein [Thioalkalivibrio sp.]|uniref:SRPBCC family protein n=1 Tax=Thioalkalivibrio sp. TaxID=2093813 RepID=UPI0039766E2D